MLYGNTTLKFFLFFYLILLAGSIFCPDQVLLSHLGQYILGKQSFAAKAAGLAPADGVKSWTSSNKKVATVSASGKIVAKKAGTATITVTLNSDYTTWFKVKVQKNAVATSSLKVLNKATGKTAAKKVTLKRKEKLNLSAVTAPVTSKQKVTYTSSKKSVVTVNSKGVVTAKKKGKATITVKSGKKTVKIQVTVK